MFERYVLKFLRTLSVDFRGKRFDVFWEHVSWNLLCRRLVDSVDSVDLSSTFLLVVSSYRDITDITSLSIFVGFFVIAERRYFEKAIYLYRDVGFIHKLS